VNVGQLRAILWLRWRLRYNQLRRAGALNAILLAIFVVGAFIFAAIVFVASAVSGIFLPEDFTPPILLLIYDGLVVGFLFAWAIGVVSELQRSEVLTLEKFLHLPVSLTGAFFINYLSSLASLTLLIFGSALVGLSLGLIFSRGLAALLLLPLVVAFLFMVTALTYQFQGWLATLMVNQRRRRTIIFVVTVAFILICQLPNLINVARPWEWGNQSSDHRMTASERREAEVHIWDQVQQTAWIVNVVLPIGWLPLGAMTTAEGRVVPALLGLLGLTLIGTVSLRRAYRTTVRFHTGQLNARPRQAAAKPVKVRPQRILLVERRLPWIPEAAAAVALATLRSLLRAPEVKLVLVGPVILVVLMVALSMSTTDSSADVPDMVRPMMSFGVMSVVLLTLSPLLGNQFGLDRSGFRALVLSPVPRRDILLGKNLAVAPLVLGLGLVLATIVELLFPARLDRFLAVLPCAASMYLLFCLAANAMSIYLPVAIAPGSFRQPQPDFTVGLLHALVGLALPVLLLPTLLPLALELGLEALGLVRGVPLALLLSLVEVVLVGGLYFIVLDWQGGWLQEREQAILDKVIAKTE
jgi:hypothetical protein